MCADSISEMDVWSERLNFFSFSYGRWNLTFLLMISIEGQKNSKDYFETKLGKIIIENSTWHGKYLVYLNTEVPEIR